MSNPIGDGGDTLVSYLLTLTSLYTKRTEVGIDNSVQEYKYFYETLDGHTLRFMVQTNVDVATTSSTFNGVSPAFLSKGLHEASKQNMVNFLRSLATDGPLRLACFGLSCCSIKFGSLFWPLRHKVAYRTLHAPLENVQGLLGIDPDPPILRSALSDLRSYLLRLHGPFMVRGLLSCLYCTR
jgi:hypothetical protein